MNMVKYYNGTVEQYRRFVEGKRVFAFGASKMFRKYVEEYSCELLCECLDCFVDNDAGKTGSRYAVGEHEWAVQSIDYLRENVNVDCVILIATMYYEEIAEVLNQEKCFENVACFVLPFMEISIKPSWIEHRSGEMKIPQKLHYCWFGGGKKSELEKKCIESWYKFCPDYEITEWNEENYDFSKNRYMQQAYDTEQWAFVSDVARLDIVYNQGGIYVDTDVEILRDISELLKNDVFMAFHGNRVSTGLGFGAVNNAEVLKLLLEDYETRSFLQENGEPDKTKCPIIQTERLRQIGVVPNGKFQRVGNLTIYPEDYFAGIVDGCGRNAAAPWGFMQHHFEGTWNPENTKRRQRRVERNVQFEERFSKLAYRLT